MNSLWGKQLKCVSHVSAIYKVAFKDKRETVLINFSQKLYYKCDKEVHYPVIGAGFSHGL
jgi:hypothetical protein